MFRKQFFIFIYILILIGLTTYIFVCDWLEYFDAWLDSVEDTADEFDYIIVGAGTAGSIVALRLSENVHNKVLLLEAGPYGKSPILNIPLIAPLLHKSIYDWQYKTVEQEHACWGFKNHSSVWPSGKIFGGSSRLNHMLYTRGDPRDFTAWYKDDPTFNYTCDVLHYFKKSERQIGQFSDDHEFHGLTGPLIASDLTYHSDLHESILEAAKCLRIPVRDINTEHFSGFSTPQVNVKDGSRFSPSHHLLNVKPSNLIIRTHSIVKEILFKYDYEARGVAYESFGSDRKVFAKLGVVVCSGTVGSAKLLLLSGIGPKGHLDEIGIKTKVDLPVGNNLQDHVSTGLDLVLFNSPLDVHLNLISPLQALQYYFAKVGFLTSVGVDVLAFLNSQCLDLPNIENYVKCEKNFDVSPDIELMFMPAGISIDFGIRMRQIVGLDDSIWNEYFTKFSNYSTASFIPIALKPKSRGFLRLKNNHFDSKPIIDPKYLSDKSDVDVLISGIRFIKKIIETYPLQKLGAKFNNVTFPKCQDHEFDSDSYWRCYVKYMSFTLYHPVGTCKMGSESDRTTVVKRDFKVKDTNKLFVVDASVFPNLISANTNAAVAMLAEKAADTIKNIQYLMKRKSEWSDIFSINTIC